MPDDPQRPDFAAALGAPPKRGGRKPTPPDSTVTDPAQLAARLVIESERLKGKTPEEIGEMILRRMANVIILAGDEFMPKTLLEATNVAKSWSQIASLERARAGGVGGKVDDGDPVQRMAVTALRHLRALQPNEGEAKSS